MSERRASSGIGRVLRARRKPGDESATADTAHETVADGAPGAGPLLSRRAALVGGATVVGGAVVLGDLSLEAPEALASTPSGTIALPTTTAPEQLRLVWGADPATEMTVSWSAPGTVPMPAPMLAYSTEPISAANSGALVFLPEPVALDATETRSEPCATSFTDGESGQTTYHYHVPLRELSADTTYYYEVSDGAGSTASGQFQTAPTGRAAYRFTVFGDQGTPPASDSASGYTWAEGGATAVVTTDGTISPGDGNGPGLFHIIDGDLGYSGSESQNHAAVWRDWSVMVAASAANRPWMPSIGNHEYETGRNGLSGKSTGGYNGAYGLGTYVARYLLPDNGVTNWDGNSLQGHFYSFQVGTVLFIGLDSNDIIFQTNDFAVTRPDQYSGALAADPSNMARVPDTTTVNPTYGIPTPNLQTQWLEQQLKAARTEGSGVEMIVVYLHMQTAVCYTVSGCELGIRTAWGPLFDEYEVDLVLSGHSHCHARTYPVRGYDPPSGWATAAFTNPFGTYAEGAVVDTRRPTVVTTEPFTLNGVQAWDTSQGTVHFSIGGGGAGTNDNVTIDPNTGVYEAPLFVDLSGTMNAAEDAPWQAFFDTANGYGYGVFDVDPGDGPGGTAITYQWFSVSSSGTETTPIEKFVFTRLNHTITPGTVEIDGDVAVGSTVTAVPGTWAPAATLSYQWLVGGAAVSDATDDSYTIAADDLGQTLQVQVTGTASGYDAETASSAAVTIADGSFTTTPVTVTGAVQVGGIVTANVGAWSPSAVMSYEWLLDGDPINGAASSTYLPVASDAGHWLQVRVTGSAPGYADAAVTSAPQTVATLVLAKFTQATVTIDGIAQGGATVTANVSWSPQATLAYQWLLDGEPIGGATSSSYTPAASDASHWLQVQVTGVASGYAITIVTSAAQSVAAAGAQGAARAATGAYASQSTVVAAVEAPSLLGTVQVGKSVQAELPATTPATKLSYQWLLNGNPIKKAGADSYTAVPADAGHVLQVRVTQASGGKITASSISQAATVRAADLKTGTLGIQGNPAVGQELKAVHAGWRPGPAFIYQWLLDGKPISRETHQELTVRGDWLGRAVSVRVTAERTGYVTREIVSGHVKIGRGELEPGSPRITGSPQVGAWLHIELGEWSPKPQFGYRWFVGGVPVADAPGRAYQVRPEDRGKRIRAEVTAWLPGYGSVARGSAPTRAVRG